jgi:hypothetical protein
VNKFPVIFAGALFVISNGLALAGPDWQIIEKARKDKQAKQAAGTQQDEKAVLPLDHGPHAQTTPWTNEQKQPEKATPTRAAEEKKQGS